MSVYAQEYGYFFNSNSGDRTYNADSFETWLRPFFVSGVFTGCLQVQAQDTPDMTVKVTSVPEGFTISDGGEISGDLPSSVIKLPVAKA